MKSIFQDVAAMGRLVGIPHFFSDQAFKEEKEDAAAQRKARKVLLDEEMYLEDDSPETRALRALSVGVAVRMQKQFDGRVIRRTIDSKDWKGESLLSLPPYKQTSGVLTLTPRESRIVQKLADQAKDRLLFFRHFLFCPSEVIPICSVSTANGVGRLMTKKFYLEYRMATGYAKDDPDDAIPIIKNIEEWEKCKSTKMDVCAKICQHLLTRDDAPDVEFEEGLPIFPPFPNPLEGIEAPKTNRILIYQEFPSLGGLLRQVSSFGFCLRILKKEFPRFLICMVSPLCS